MGDINQHVADEANKQVNKHEIVDQLTATAVLAKGQALLTPSSTEQI